MPPGRGRSFTCYQRLCICEGSVDLLDRPKAGYTVLCIRAKGMAHVDFESMVFERSSIDVVKEDVESLLDAMELEEHRDLQWRATGEDSAF